jgi:arginine/lysine/ornithine decarboxylase
LVDCDVEWLYPEGGDNLISCRVSADQVEKKLDGMTDLPVAVYLTCPDYLGVLSDVKGIAEVCKKYGILLIVDNAHGAYLRFLPDSRHPLDLGADICCDSAHKTLPVLTGGAYLHISENAPKLVFDMAEQAMSLFSSTSPSYLILQSLDMANKYLYDGYGARLADTAKRIGEMKAALSGNGFSLVGDEVLKVCIEAKKYGYFGQEIAEYLKERNIVCEFYDRDYVVMMFTPENSDKDIGFVESALFSLPQKDEINETAPQLRDPEKLMTVRAAIMSPSIEIDVKNAQGRVLATPSVSCPPAIPIVICGELIDENTIKLFEYYGTKKCRVVK